MILASVLAMYLSYAGVDQSLTVSRASSVLAVALALAFSLPAIGRAEDA